MHLCELPALSGTTNRSTASPRQLERPRRRRYHGCPLARERLMHATTKITLPKTMSSAARSTFELPKPTERKSTRRWSLGRVLPANPDGAVWQKLFGRRARRRSYLRLRRGARRAKASRFREAQHQLLGHAHFRMLGWRRPRAECGATPERSWIERCWRGTRTRSENLTTESMRAAATGLGNQLAQVPEVGEEA